MSLLISEILTFISGSRLFLSVLLLCTTFLLHDINLLMCDSELQRQSNSHVKNGQINAFFLNIVFHQILLIKFLWCLRITESTAYGWYEQWEDMSRQMPNGKPQACKTFFFFCGNMDNKHLFTIVTKAEQKSNRFKCKKQYSG